MPTYEYECPRCPRVFEVKQRITAPALKICDRCGGPIHRLLSAAPFILKGEGWYVTDYPSESRKKAKESEKSASEKEKSSGDNAGEKKDGAPAEKAGEKKDAAPAEKASSPSPTPSTSVSAPAAS